MAGLAPIASTSSLAAVIAEPILQRVVSEVPSPTPIPSFQDIDSETQSDDETEEDWEAIVALAEAAFTDEEVDFMQHFLKEKGLFAFVKRFVQDQQIPIPKLLLAFGILVPAHVTSLGEQLRILKVACSRVLRNREKLEEYSTVDDAINLIAKSKKILVLTGAGVSTSCGIPDFRSPTGLYARLKEENWELEDPQEMFDLTFFKEKPNVFYSFAKEIYPSNFVPSPCHRFVRLLELNDRLLRNYTQNIDGLFEEAGVEKMLNCHGSFATASCLRCRTQFPGSAIEADVFAQRVPLCPLCTAFDAAQPVIPPKKIAERWDFKQESDEEEEIPLGEWEGKPLIKPDIVFFGEMLSDEFDRRLLEDREEVDLLIVIGTSLRVSPVAQIVSHLPHSVPQILINRDPITHANFDIHMLGDGDTIVRYLCDKLSKKLGDDSFDLSQIKLRHDPPVDVNPLKPDADPIEPERVADSHVWLFPGANGGKWVERIREAFATPTSSEEGSSVEQNLNLEGSNGEGVDGGQEGLRVPEEESRSRSRSKSGTDDEEEEGLSKRIRVNR